ncbi:hypothetical protein B9Z55_022099 [Caenorhabditis nigoni]|uniref:MRG domain-containing protein n=3 Tax=Caenorhabditis nigoni TaxID=1611254 RepID=A0A2G5TUY4_9PELO|nr:hypothetical protein B9Z55_022099 [Caenorhabditis nigoni]
MSNQHNGTRKPNLDVPAPNSGSQTTTKIWRTRIPESLPLAKYPPFRLPTALEDVIKKDYLNCQDKAIPDFTLHSIEEIIKKFKSDFQKYDAKIAAVDDDYAKWRNQEGRQLACEMTLVSLGEYFNKLYQQLLYKNELKNAQEKSVKFATQQRIEKMKDSEYAVKEFKATEHYGFVHFLRLLLKLPNFMHSCRYGRVWTFSDIKDVYDSLKPCLHFLIEQKEFFLGASNNKRLLERGDDDDNEMETKPKMSRHENDEKIDGVSSNMVQSGHEGFKKPITRWSKKNRRAAE